MYIMETFHATEFLMWEEAVLFIEPTSHHGEKLQVISYKKYNIFIFAFEKRFSKNTHMNSITNWQCIAPIISLDSVDAKKLKKLTKAANNNIKAKRGKKRILS